MEPWKERSSRSFDEMMGISAARGVQSDPTVPPPPDPMQQPIGAMQPPAPYVPGPVMTEVMSGPAAHAGRGILRGAAGVGDGLIGLGQKAMGGEATNPLGAMVKENIDPYFSQVGFENNPVAGAVAKTAEFGGEMVAPFAAGGAAVNVAAKGMGALGTGATASSRMGQYVNDARNFVANLSPTFAKFGAGPAPLPGASNVANMGARVGTGAAAGGTAAFASDADDPMGVGMGVVTGGVVGPAGQKLGEYGVDLLETGSRALRKTRVPQLTEEVIRDVVNGRGQQVLTNIGRQGERIGTGLPTQVASDPGISSIDRLLSSRNTKGYGGTTADFMADQADDLARNVQGQSAGLSADRAARGQAIAPLSKALGSSMQPVKTTQIGNQYSRLLPGGDLQGNNNASGIFREVLDPSVVRMGPGQEGLLKTVPAGVMFNMNKQISSMLSPKYQLNGRALDGADQALLYDLKGALEGGLRQSRGGTASRDFKDFQSTYHGMSKPVNQKEKLLDLYNDSVAGAPSHKGADVLEPNKLGNIINDIKQKKEVWNQFTAQQQKYLTQLRTEATGNANARNIGVGGADELVAEKAIPKAATTMTRPLPFMLGRGTNAALRIVGGGQERRIQESLADIMSQPGGINTIEQILRGSNTPRPEATGRIPALLEQILATQAPRITPQ